MQGSLQRALPVYSRIGLLSFGGPAGQIALMHREFVDERQWLTEKEFLAALNFCMLLPGPEAMQLATYVGWKQHGLRGGLAAGLLFVMPGACIVLALSMLYGAFGALPWVTAIFFGIKAAVLAIVIEALLRVARRALKHRSDWVIAALAFLALFAFALPFPLIILAAAVYGLWSAPNNAHEAATAPIGIGTTLRTILTWLVIWWAPLLLITAALGQGHVLSEIGIYFSKLAVVTFGGAYAVLSAMAQSVVEQKQWLTGPEMIDGLGLAETTPGPLILVTEFVGYLAAQKATGSIWGGIAGAVVTLWATFAPCFLWIFAGAPYIESINTRPRLSGALAAITAAVVGVILNLSIWFGLHVLFGQVERASGWFKPWLPDWASFNISAAVLSVIAAIALLRFHLGIPKTLALCALLGAITIIFG